jgi:hypothetical protein
MDVVRSKKHTRSFQNNADVLEDIIMKQKTNSTPAARAIRRTNAKTGLVTGHAHDHTAAADPTGGINGSQVGLTSAAATVTGVNTINAASI